MSTWRWVMKYVNEGFRSPCTVLANNETVRTTLGKASPV